MLVKFANIVAIGFAAFGVQQTIATPVHDTETHDIARRTKSLKCGWVKSKHGKDLGCLCDSVIGRINADFDVSDVLSLLFSKGSKNYPPGCKPTCDGNGGYECPNGKDSKGNCLDDHGCEGGSCWDNGKCCPGGTVNRDGICCPPGCSNKGGKCHVDEPPKQEPPKQTCGKYEDSTKDGKCKCKDGFSREHEKAPCVKVCPTDQKPVEDHCECKNTEFKPDHEKVCRPQCKAPLQLDKKSNSCVCPSHLPIYEHGKCKAAPPSCTHPKKLNEEKNACVCVTGYKENHEKMCILDCKDGKVPDPQGKTCVCLAPKIEEHGKCVIPPPTCTHPKKLNDQKTGCICVTGYKENHEKMCILDCKDGKVPDDKGKMCICALPKKEDKHGKCVDVPKCTHPEELNTWTNKCECAHGYQRDEHGKCMIKCKGDKLPDHEGKMCVCPTGKVEKPDNKDKCVYPAPTCTHPEELNKHTNKCDCVKGYERDWHTGKCVIKCKGDLIPEPHEGKTCVCPTGKVPKEHNSNQCVDPAPTCTHPEKLSKNGKKCVCEDGFKRHGNGKCERDCGRGKKWCKTKCCRDDQEEKDNGQCGCPHDWKEKKFGGKTMCAE